MKSFSIHWCSMSLLGFRERWPRLTWAICVISMEIKKKQRSVCSSPSSVQECVSTHVSHTCTSMSDMAKVQCTVVLACKAWPSARVSGLRVFVPLIVSLSSSTPTTLPPQSPGINPGKWEGLLPPCCYSLPGVQIPGQPRIRQLHCQSVRKKSNKWQLTKSTRGCEVSSRRKVRSGER